jgi:hypothetical protein
MKRMLMGQVLPPGTTQANAKNCVTLKEKRVEQPRRKDAKAGFFTEAHEGNEGQDGEPDLTAKNAKDTKTEEP